MDVLFIELPAIVQQAVDSAFQLDDPGARWSISLWAAPRAAGAAAAPPTSSALEAVATELAAPRSAARLTAELVVPIDAAADDAHPCRPPASGGGGGGGEGGAAPPDPRV
jgi:hypothetical protein